MVVDDAHWADAASLRYLAFLLTRLEELDVALVLATRPREAGTDAELLASGDDRSVRRCDPSSSADAARPSPSSSSRGSAGVPDPVFVDACLRATRGTPFLMRVLVDALSEGGIAPTAEAARHVERIGARTVGRSIRLRLRRLPEHAGRLARALAVLEQGDLLQAARLAGLDEAEAADAAELLTTAGILEPGRPLTFIHPIVRSGIYSELSGAERAQGHRRAARLLAEQPGADERVAKHLLVSEPAGDGWVVERLVEAACAAGKQGAPESEAVFLRRALAEPPPPGDRSALLLDLGMAEASAGLADWPEHLQQAVDTAPNADGSRRCSARARARAQPRPALRGGGRRCSIARRDLVRHSRLGPRAPARSRRRRRRAERPRDRTVGRASAVRRCARRAAGDPAAPPELLAAAAFISVLTNEPAEVGADLADPGAARRRDCAAAVGDPAVVRVRGVVLAGDALAALGRAVRPAAAAARCLDRAGAGDRRQQPARCRPGQPRLARAPTRRSERRRGRRADGACRDRAPRTDPVPRPERRCARRGARRSGRARRGRAGARAARLRSRERIDHRRGPSRRPRPAAGRTGTSRRRARGLPGRRRSP